MQSVTTPTVDTNKHGNTHTHTNTSTLGGFHGRGRLRGRSYHYRGPKQCQIHLERCELYYSVSVACLRGVDPLARRPTLVGKVGLFGHMLGTGGVAIPCLWLPCLLARGLRANPPARRPTPPRSALASLSPCPGHEGRLRSEGVKPTRNCFVGSEV